MSEEPVIVNKVDLPVDEARWITLKKISWKDQDGKDRTWESAERKTRSEGGVDAVAVLAILTSANGSFPPSTIIIEQYRPPVGAYVIEMPAGLIDKGESPESAAMRELEEETGYKAEGVLDVSPLMVCDPGMSSANMKLAVLKVPVPDTPSSPKQKLEAGEHIVRRVVELAKLKDELAEYEKKGYVVDARLSHFAIGWDMARKIQGAL